MESLIQINWINQIRIMNKINTWLVSVLRLRTKFLINYKDWYRQVFTVLQRISSCNGDVMLRVRYVEFPIATLVHIEPWSTFLSYCRAAPCKQTGTNRCSADVRCAAAGSSCSFDIQCGQVFLSNSFTFVLRWLMKTVLFRNFIHEYYNLSHNKGISSITISWISYIYFS